MVDKFIEKYLQWVFFDKAADWGPATLPKNAL